MQIVNGNKNKKYKYEGNKILKIQTFIKVIIINQITLNLNPNKH